MNDLRKLYPLATIILIVFVIACSGNDSAGDESEELGQSDTVSTDTLTAADTIQIELDPNRPVIDLDQLIAKADKTFDLPLTIDSSFITSFALGYDEDIDYNLTLQEAEYLAFDYVGENTTGNSEYDVIRFIFMDSLMQAGQKAYDDYQASLDLGMTRYSIANVIGKIELSDISFLMLWHTDYSTYEACPYGSGTCVYATLFTKGVAINTLLVGEESGGGDPPVWGDTRVSSKITAESILIKKIDRFGEEDYDSGEEIVEVTKSESDISITPYGMVTMENRGE